MDSLDWVEEAAAAYDRRPAPAPVPPPPANGHAARNGHAADDDGRPGDDFNRRAAWEEVLAPHGWRPVGRAGQKTYWRRPGKEERAGWSATTGHCASAAGGDLLYVFSSNAAPFEPERAYSKFSAHALLDHGGDFKAAAAALRARGYGRDGEIKFTSTRRTAAPTEAETGDPLDGDATAADLIRIHATIRWVWEGWVPVGVLTILASEPGVGKTRFCADLLRRVHHGLPWPDGSAPTLPKGSVALWVPADNQHAELGTLPTAFGFPPECLYLNATRRNPMAGTMLDAPEDLADFEKRLARVRPALVFIDTSLNATDRSAHKPEDAKAFFKPLMEIAARTDCGVVCVTHLNAGGKPLGRRVMGQGRVVMQLEKPDPSQENRRKLYVVKSNSLFPAPLGVTMDTHGNEYDLDPPSAPQSGPGSERGGRPSHNEEDCAWLRSQLEGGAKRVSFVRREAENAGISTPRLYRAKEAMTITEYESQGKKWWVLPPETFDEA